MKYFLPKPLKKYLCNKTEFVLHFSEFFSQIGQEISWDLATVGGGGGERLPGTCRDSTNRRELPAPFLSYPEVASILEYRMPNSSIRLYSSITLNPSIAQIQSKSFRLRLYILCIMTWRCCLYEVTSTWWCTEGMISIPAYSYVV